MSDLPPYPLAEAVRAAYRAGEDDETMEPLVRVNGAKGQSKPIGRIQDGDYVIFYDLRGEREVELTQAFVEEEFPYFGRKPMVTHWATMIEYDPALNVQVAYPPLGEVEERQCDESQPGHREVPDRPVSAERMGQLCSVVVGLPGVEPEHEEACSEVSLTFVRRVVVVRVEFLVELVLI